MENPIKPYVADIELEDHWQEGSDDEDFNGDNPQIRWFKSYDVYLGDKNKTHPAGSFPGFFVHYLVCSPAMQNNPPRDLASEILTAHIQQKFDEKEALEFLNEKVSAIQVANLEGLRNELGSFTYIF